MSTAENEENSSGSITAAAAAPATASAPAMIFKPQLREVKYDESMTTMVPRMGTNVPGSVHGHPRERAVPDGLHDQHPHARAAAALQV